MATAPQILANRANAQLSTGPRSEAGKAVVAQNRLSHGLSSKNFSFLPNEDPQAFTALVDSLEDEHNPATPTEAFLVVELARAQWKLDRIMSLEAEILAGGESSTGWSAVAQSFRQDCSQDQVLLKLNRYEQAARRAWHKALEQLRKCRAAADMSDLRQSRARVADAEALISAIVAAPAPGQHPRPLAVSSPKEGNYDSKPMPAHLRKELDAHKRRDPLFDPQLDRSQMSRELRRYFERQ